jgi:hypothetical protein
MVMSVEHTTEEIREGLYQMASAGMQKSEAPVANAISGF